MRNVLDRFLAQAVSHPNHPAVQETDSAITYADFAHRIRCIATAIASLSPNARVLILLPQGADAYAAMLATAMAGGVYSPANVGAPVAKQRLVLQQFSPDVIVSTPALYAALTAGAPAAPLIDPANTRNGTPLAQAHPAHDLAYVIFTSGSTGIPKGVMISHAALAHYVEWAQKTIGPTPADRWSQHPNIAFDLSVLDIYGALCGGATLCPLMRETHRLMPARGIRDLGLTIWNSVPSVVGLMIKARQVTRENLATLRLMTFCGEPLLPEHLRAIFAARPDLPVFNTYGPTEATVSCTLVRLTADTFSEHCHTSAAIGDAIPGMAIRLLDGPNEDEGEIAISGPQLANGYLGDAAATAKAFRPADIDGMPARTYYTGDWAKRIGKHTFFVSRRDFQVKILGYRVELDEVTAALRKCGYTTAASILYRGELHAFVESPQDVDAEKARAQLSALLEPHAVPQVFHALPHLPRNENDKIDLLALSRILDDQGQS